MKAKAFICEVEVFAWNSTKRNASFVNYKVTYSSGRKVFYAPKNNFPPKTVDRFLKQPDLICTLATSYVHGVDTEIEREIWKGDTPEATRRIYTVIPF